MQTRELGRSGLFVSARVAAAAPATYLVDLFEDTRKPSRT